MCKIPKDTMKILKYIKKHKNISKFELLNQFPDLDKKLQGHHIYYKYTNTAVSEYNKNRDELFQSTLNDIPLDKQSDYVNSKIEYPKYREKYIVYCTTPKFDTYRKERIQSVRKSIFSFFQTALGKFVAIITTIFVGVITALIIHFLGL